MEAQIPEELDRLDLEEETNYLLILELIKLEKEVKWKTEPNPIYEEGGITWNR